ncbi:MAG: beta-ketoacyl-[acyl-carrier-protein] synthase family protein [Acidobacteriota bacterium]|nr:beta-ketoacyl-[acyl-carrier-protein] synthase family protein [Acidobacteriota bacterium]
MTGYGAITPYGVGVATLIEGLKAGRSAVCNMSQYWSENVEGRYCMLAAPVLEGFEERSIPRRLRRSMGRSACLTYVAVQEAIEHAELPGDTLKAGRVGVAFGESMPSASALETFFDEYLLKRSLANIPAGGFFRVMGHSVAANVANAFGVTGRVAGTPGACASGAMAVGLGYEMVSFGVQDVMICGGVEECHGLTSAVFDILGASSTHWNAHPERSPAPFDRDRDGTVCGEAAGAIVVEAEEHALRRGAPILARVLGFAGIGTGNGMAQAGSASMERCLRMALSDAGLEAEYVGYVNAHATATIQGDSAESSAIRAVFGGGVPVSGLKGYFGHTLGASGAVESIASIEMMLGGYLVPTGKLRNVDECCQGINHVREFQQADLDAIVKCSFGFGGINAALVLGRYEDEP